MILISHRGNINGIIKERENHPDYLKQALSLGYNIELDVWLKNGQWFLGHEQPNFPIKESFFTEIDSGKAWYHAKNVEALGYLRQKPNLHSYWHQEDNYALTSRGYIWVHCFNGELLKNSICILPEVRKSNEGLKGCAGICSDFIENYKKYL
jgi:hypothetical protein